MIQTRLYDQVILDTVRRGATEAPADVKEAFIRAIGLETSSSSRVGLERTLESMELSAVRGNPTCPDTGWPIFYLKIGNECEIEGGMMALEESIKKAVTKATHDGYLRSTMKHPLTGFDPGNNIGMNIPNINYKFVPGDSIEVTYVAKGGGSECFGGTRYRMIALADGLAGIKKFVLDCYIEATRAGAICPPSILGVGIGGTANVAANLAKEAACLRVIGSRHSDPLISQIEENLYEGISALGIGTMASGGDTSVLGVNIEYAFTHIAGIAVATSSNCMVARRASSRILADGTVLAMESPNWFEGR